MRRLAKVEMAAEVLCGLCKPTAPNFSWRVFSGVPEDAKAVSFGFDHTRQVFIILWEHPTFPEVAEGREVTEVIPILSQSIFIPAEGKE